MRHVARRCLCGLGVADAAVQVKVLDRRAVCRRAARCLPCDATLRQQDLDPVQLAGIRRTTGQLEVTELFFVCADVTDFRSHRPVARSGLCASRLCASRTYPCSTFRLRHLPWSAIRNVAAPPDAALVANPARRLCAL